MRRAVFLDRDGVLNRSPIIGGVPRPPASISEVEILPGVIEALQILKKHNLVPVVVTNQPDVARGYATQSHVEAINAQIGARTRIEHFYTCFHDDADLCNCRKPSPGLIYSASRELDLSMSESFLVGDRWRDIAAGQTAGCQTFFIDYSYAEKKPNLPYRKVSSLLEAATLIVGEIYGTK
jgi:D-glycero-D-manno-heptose 1,7-bisphosphate phosphatase